MAIESAKVLRLADFDVLMTGVTRRFGDLTALSNVDLRAKPGTILGVIGPSGAGKTTCLRLLTGALMPTEGKVWVLGHDPARQPRSTRRKIGYMPQQLTLMPELTARGNVSFAASLSGMLWPLRPYRVRQMLRLVELEDAGGRQARHLSGGMQRRVELASTLIHDPQIMFLDEPTAGIDPILRQHIWEELRRRRDDGRTIVVTTQYVTEAEGCDDVALISAGRVAAFGTPLQLRRQAFGGDVVAVETKGAFDSGTLMGVAGVRKVSQMGACEFELTVNDAGKVIPAIMEAVNRKGGELASARELRPSFEEVFTRLVERAAAQDHTK